MLKATTLTVILGAIALVTPATASPHATVWVCPAMHLRASVLHPATGQEPCKGNITPHIYVDGKLLVDGTAKGSDVVIYYGRGAAVRVHQVADRRVDVTAVTFRDSVDVVARFARTGGGVRSNTGNRHPHPDSGYRSSGS